MHLTFAPRNILQIEDASFVFRTNFEGRAEKFNNEGSRYFNIRIPNQEIADELVANGWNVAMRDPRDGDDDPLYFLKVKVKYTDRSAPRAYLITNGVKNELNEDTIEVLDRVDIENIDMYIRPYDWNVNGKTGRTAYLDAIYVTQKVDYLAAKYADEEYPEE